MSVTDDLDFEGAATTPPTDVTVRQIAELAKRQMALEDEIVEVTAELVALQADLETVSTELLPEIMREHGVTGITLKDGSTLEIKVVIRASIPKAHQTEALNWLEDSGHGDLIKSVVKASFGRGEDVAAERLVRHCEDLGYVAEMSQGVHPQTLGAFVREQLEVGAKIPLDLLGVFRAETSKITRHSKR